MLCGIAEHRKGVKKIIEKFTINGVDVVSFSYDEHKEKITFYDAFMCSICDIEFTKTDYEKIENCNDVFEKLANIFSD